MRRRERVRFIRPKNAQRRLVGRIVRYGQARRKSGGEHRRGLRGRGGGGGAVFRGRGARSWGPTPRRRGAGGGRRARGQWGAWRAGVAGLWGPVGGGGARYGIRPSAFSPVGPQTPLVAAFAAGSRAPADEARARLVSGIPLGRLGDPADVAS